MNIAIYIRTSTEEQEPENQIKEIELISGKEYLLFKEKQSAWKDNVDREEFIRLKKEIATNKIKSLYVWDLDRLFRNRKKLIEFFEFCKIHRCNVHSYRQQWLEELNNMPEPFNEIMFNLMLHIMGWLAEEESRKKSERVNLAVVKVDGKKTKSYKGNLWGYHSLGNNVEEKIIELYNQGKKLREIKEKVYYWDKNNNKKYVSLGFVHKLISKYKKENSSNNQVQEMTN